MADKIVESLVILELKDVGLILNFAEKGVEVKRKVRELDDLSA